MSEKVLEAIETRVHWSVSRSLVVGLPSVEHRVAGSVTQRKELASTWQGDRSQALPELQVRQQFPWKLESCTEIPWSSRQRDVGGEGVITLVWTKAQVPPAHQVQHL